jgi:hypothetical protein
MITLNVGWEYIKSFAQKRSVSIQFIDINNMYYLSAIDGAYGLTCQLAKDTSNDTIDFETNFKPTANRKLDALDSDGAKLQRLKVTTVGWALHYHGLELTTSTINGVIDKNENNSDYGFSTVKLYDESDNLLSAGSEAACVKTVIDWEPTFDYDIIGGDIFLNSPITADIRAYVIGVPDIPSSYGGAKVFLSGLNLKYISQKIVRLDGKTPKSLKYNSSLHTNKIRFVFYHDAGVVQTILVMLNIFMA